MIFKEKIKSKYYKRIRQHELFRNGKTMMNKIVLHNVKPDPKNCKCINVLVF